MKTEKVFETASDLNIAAVYGYVKSSSDNYVYADAKFQTKLDKETCKNMFLMGYGVINQNGNLYRIVSAKITGEEVSLTYVKDGSTVVTVYSAEHGA